jgi:hypothetical protein
VRKLIVVLLLLGFCEMTFGQRGMRWKRTRYELMGGVGGAAFMGDLGGGKNPDSKLDDYFGDLDVFSSRPAMWMAMRYKLSPSFAVRGNLILGQVSGDDKWSGDQGRKSRNLNFRSPIFEQSLQLEYSIIKENDARKWHKRKKRSVRGNSFNLYTFAGFGGFWFNPKGEDPYGNWVKLRPIGTEGQTADGKNEMYSRYAMCFPGGLGVKIGINRKWDFGVEYGLRYTLTDYIDDVGSSYYDNRAIVEANGGNSTAGWMADKHLVSSDSQKFGAEVKNPTHEYFGIYQPGDRKPYAHGSSFRGGKSNDVYMFFLFSLCYKMETKRNGLPKFR